MGVMDERSSRLFVGGCLLVLLWVGTYWAYDPGPARDAPTISFDVPEDAGPPAEPAQARAPAETPARPAPPATGPGAGESPAPVVTTPAQPPADPGVRVVPPRFREHVIGPNETFETIAQRYYGAAGLGSVIARANPLKDPRRLRPGEVLRVPLDPENVQGVVVRADDGMRTEPPPAPDGVVEYRVKAGDSLSRIAQSYYGSVRHADFIFESNRDVLASPDRLRVGQVLRLPPLPGASAPD